jgi:hypothetical protein
MVVLLWKLNTILIGEAEEINNRSYLEQENAGFRPAGASPP